MTGFITCIKLILRSWNEKQTPTPKMWREKMIGTVACEKMLWKINPRKDMTKD